MPWSDWDNFPKRATADERRKTVARETERMRQAGQIVRPIEIDGRQIAKTFWGQAWCRHIECLSDFASRLDRGKTYARNGSVFHLDITPGKVFARVAGSELYDVTVEVQPLDPRRWNEIKRACAGQITSAVELLSGKLSDATMHILTDPEAGMFPHADDFDLDCSCPDFARLCKHLAAVLYGVGARLDAAPDLLFTLRGVDPTELIAQAATNLVSNTPAGSAKKTVKQADLADVFGIELADVDLDVAAEPETSTPSNPPAKTKKPSAGRRRPRKT